MILAQDEHLARRVGAVTLLLLAAAIAFFVFVWDHIEIGSHTRIRAYFAQTGGLREQAAVVVAGRTIGRVEAIEEVPHGATGPLGGAQGVVATIALDRGETWKVPRTAELFVSSRGMLSEKYLEVGQPHEPAPAVSEGDQLRGIDPPSLDTVIQHSWANMLAFRAFADDVKPELDALRREVAALLTHFDDLASDLATLSPSIAGIAPLIADAREIIAQSRYLVNRSLGGDAGFARAAAVISAGRATIAQVRVALDALALRAAPLVANVDRIRAHVTAHDPVDGTQAVLARVRAMLDKLDPLLAQVAALNDRLAKGEGSLGRLMNDPEFPEDAKELGKIMKRQPWKVIGHPPE